MFLHDTALGHIVSRPWYTHVLFKTWVDYGFGGPTLACWGQK